MSEPAAQKRRDTAVPASPVCKPEVQLGRIPRATVHAFCETPGTAAAIEAAAGDRRMARATTSVMIGGIKAALAHYRQSPTPGLILLESRAGDAPLLADLDALAHLCDVKTRVIVVGVSNEIDLYRQLMKRGISEYLRAPVEPSSLIAAVAGAFGEAGAGKAGRVYAFVGARGGVGSSTIAQNVAFALGDRAGGDVILVDMDLAFGTAGLNFGLEPSGGIGDAVRGAERLDEQILDRLLTPCGDRLNLLAAPALPDTPLELDADAFEAVLELAQGAAAHVVLDIPHVWTGWSKKTLLAADEVVIVAAPELASLKHAKHLVEVLRHARPNDPEPRLVLNQVGVPKRPEIKPADFAAAVQLAPAVAVPFDAAAFGAAANSGRMLAAASGRSAPAAAIRALAETLGGSSPAGRRSGMLGGWLRRAGSALRKA